MKILGSYDKKTKLDKTMDIPVRKPSVKSKYKQSIGPSKHGLNKSYNESQNNRQNRSVDNEKYRNYL